MASRQAPPAWRIGTWLGATVMMVVGDVLIGVDQAAPGVVMPRLQAVFHFGTFGAGWVGGIQQMSFGVAGFVGAGWLSDRINNRKPIMIPCLAAFGVLSWLTGVVDTYWQLLLVRCVMGAFGGGWLSLMFTRSGESGPSWARTLAGGLSIASVGGGLGLVAPQVVPPLAEAVGWRPVFFIVGIPAVLLALIAIRYLPGGVDSTIDPLVRSAEPLRLAEAFRYRNIVVSAVVCAFLFGTLSLFIVFGTVYLTHQGFTLPAAGDALSGWGIGGVLLGIGACLLAAVGIAETHPRQARRAASRPARDAVGQG